MREDEVDEDDAVLQHVGPERDLVAVLRDEAAIAEEQPRRLFARTRAGLRSWDWKARSRRSALHARRRVRPHARTQPMLLRATATEGPRYLHARWTMPWVEHPRCERCSLASIIRRAARCRSIAHATCSRTIGDGSSARLCSAVDDRRIGRCVAERDGDVARPALVARSGGSRCLRSCAGTSPHPRRTAS